MNTKKIVSLAINVILIGFIASTLWNRYQVSQAHKPLINHSIAVKGLIDLDGQPSELDSNPKAIIFWATWCGPCTAELARIRSAVEDGTLKSDSVVAIAVWDTLDEVAKAVKERSYNFPIVIDTQNSASTNFKVAATPTTVFLSANQVVKEISTGLSMMPASAINKFIASEHSTL